MKGEAVIMGDTVFAGIFEDEISEVPCAVVVKFDSIESMRSALLTGRIELSPLLAGDATESCQGCGAVHAPDQNKLCAL